MLDDAAFHIVRISRFDDNSTSTLVGVYLLDANHGRARPAVAKCLAVNLPRFPFVIRGISKSGSRAVDSRVGQPKCLDLMLLAQRQAVLQEHRSEQRRAEHSYYEHAYQRHRHHDAGTTL
jgi:hypothetical protein